MESLAYKILQESEISDVIFNWLFLSGYHSNQNNAEQFAVQFESVYYKSSEDSAMVDHAGHNCIIDDSELNDTYKLCSEISVEIIDRYPCHAHR